MDDIAGLQAARPRDDGLPNRAAADGITFPLNRRAAPAPNGSGHTRPELQMLVRRVDDRIGVKVGDVALDQP